jgi:hypothetical protein
MPRDHSMYNSDFKVAQFFTGMIFGFVIGGILSALLVRDAGPGMLLGAAIGILAQVTFAIAGYRNK